MGGVTILRFIKFIWLPAILFTVMTLVSHSSYAQTEEDVLNSIGSELEGESSKKKAAAKIDKEYNAIKTKAAAAYKAKRFDKAKEYYSQMLTLKPDSDFASSKLVQIDQLIAAEKEKEAEKKYQAIITKADALLATEKWTEASAKYKEALASMPNEAYPKSQLAKVSKLEADAKKAAEAAVLQKKYDDVLATAERALSAQSWDVAKQQFQNASALKPDESYPREKAVEIEKLRAAAIAKAKKVKLDKEYTSKVAKGDQLYTSHKWTESIAAYKLAQGLKPGESYPKEQVTKATARIKDELDKKKKAEQLETDFQKHKKVGEDALASKNWMVAIESFRTASSLKPTNTDITGLLNQAKSSKKAAEDLALKEKAKAEAEVKTQKQFDSEMAKGKQAMTSKNWDLARASFNKAKKLIPAESSPVVKLTELNVLIADENAAKAAAEEKKIADEAAQKAKLAEEQRIIEEQAAKQAAEEKAKQLAAATLAAEEAAAEEARKKETARIAAESAALAEAKRLADIETEKAKAEEEAKVAALAKQEADAKAKEEQRLAAEKAAEELAQQTEAAELAAKAEAEAAAIAETKRLADLAAEKAKAEEEAREVALAKAEAEAKNLEEKKLVAEAAALAETKRLADLAAVKAKAEEDAKAAALAQSEADAKNAEEQRLVVEAAEIAETKRLDELATAKAEADEVARVAALAKVEADAKNIEEQKLAAEKVAEEAAQKKETNRIAVEAAALAETKRLAELATQKAKADEEAKVLALAKAEAEAETAAKNKAEQEIAAEKEKARLAEEQARKKSEFDQAVVEYKDAIENSEWDLALRAINSAEAFFPDNQEVLKMHRELSALQKAEKNALAAEKAKDDKAKAKEKEYQAFIQNGDQQLANKKYDAAKSSFNNALKLKPNEDYPKSQLATIKEMVLAANAAEFEKQKAIDQEYSNYLAEGEKFIKDKSWTEAKASFNKAKKVKPNNQGPAERIAEIDRLIKQESDLANQAAALEEDYKERLKNGQISLDNKKFADAKRFYFGASKLKPNEALPKEKLKETELLWAAFVAKEKEAAAKQKADELEANYNGFIMSGDQSISNKMWDEAIKSYQGAVALKPEEAYPKEKLSLAKKEKSMAIAAAEKSRAEEEARLLALEAERIKADAQARKMAEQESAFAESITRGDAAMNIESYKSAVAQYRKAVKIKPENADAVRKLGYATTKYKESEAVRLAEVAEQKRVASIELKKRQEAARIEREAYLAEIRKNSPEELAKKYPDGLTEEVDTDHEVVLTKSIIVEKGEGRYLIRFDYPWGEHFYYLNGRKIRADTYNWNVRKYKF